MPNIIVQFNTVDDGSTLRLKPLTEADIAKPDPLLKERMQKCRAAIAVLLPHVSIQEIRGINALSVVGLSEEEGTFLMEAIQQQKLGIATTDSQFGTPEDWDDK